MCRLDVAATLSLQNPPSQPAPLAAPLGPLGVEGSGLNCWQRDRSFCFGLVTVSSRQPPHLLRSGVCFFRPNDRLLRILF